MPAVEASALEKHRNSSVSATSAALMKRNGRSASAFPQPLQRHETDDIKEEPTMIVHPEPSAIIPDRRIYRSEEHTSELQSLMRISYAVFCLKKKITNEKRTINHKQQLE